MRRVLYTLVLGLVGAGVVHLAVLFLLPQFSEQDAWAMLGGSAEPYRAFAVEPAARASAFSPADPLFATAACTFDLSDGAVRVTAPGQVAFWSASIYDRSGLNLYSLNDRSSELPALDLIVLTPSEMVDLRKDLPPELEKATYIEQDMDEGVIVVRAFVPDPSWKPRAAAFLGGLRCAPLPQ